MISKKQKQEIINNLVDKLSRQKAVIFSDYTGLKVSQIQELRRELREKGIDYQVAKKTLIDLALEKAGFKNVRVKELPGQIALVFGYQDEVLPAKILYNFAKGNESLKILAGLVQGEYLESEAVINLAKLPSREELLAKLVSNVGAPLAGLINTLQGNLRKLIFILKNLKLEA
jgi:large subunit ribosomal protein L10